LASVVSWLRLFDSRLREAVLSHLRFAHWVLTLVRLGTGFACFLSVGFAPELPAIATRPSSFVRSMKALAADLAIDRMLEGED